MEVSALAELVRERRPCVVLSGAGISTESGIPDFRSASGLWAEFDPFEYGSVEAFRADPVKVWRFYARRFHTLVAAEPNAGHTALAALERAGYVGAVVTQNIDGLHQRGGSREVVEVHGSIRTASCPACGEVVELADVLAQLSESEAPTCPSCPTILKPDVVFFGELLPEQAIERAYRLAGQAGLMLVVGSSLEVYPVADLPHETLRHGGRLAIVNRGATPLDHRADVRLDSGAGEALSLLVQELNAAEPSPGRGVDSDAL